MALSKEDVKHIATLARLEMSEEEMEKFSKQLSAILEHAKLLEEVDTEGVEPIAQITGLEHVTEKDQAKACEETDQLLDQSPNGTVNRMIKVKKVL